VEIVTLRVRRVGKAAQVRLPKRPQAEKSTQTTAKVTLADGTTAEVRAMDRAQLVHLPPQAGPLLVIDPEATTFVPPGWKLSAKADGTLLLESLT
jgi:N-methylhydantoinase A/oxoprolinase/acetone carboxylase beta subunit